MDAEPEEIAHGGVVCDGKGPMMRLMLLTVASFLLLGCSDQSLRRSDTPIASATELANFYPTLPASATDIYYLDYAGGMQDLERYVRFTVPASEVDSVVDKLIAENNWDIKRELSYPRQALSATQDVRPRAEFLPMPWWATSAIASGYHRGEQEAYALRIWADTATGTIFVYQND